jgi:hypothetical protein
MGKWDTGDLEISLFDLIPIEPKSSTSSSQKSAPLLVAGGAGLIEEETS